MHEHKNGLNEGFAAKYKCYYLVYFEAFWNIGDAIAREKQLKRWHKEWKWNLIRSINPELLDLSSDWFDDDNNLIEMPL